MSDPITLRMPSAEDGMHVYRLISQCPPLDQNSSYCNLLQCSHFADTCVLGELNGEIVSFMSAYLLPGKPDTLFIWQVAVSDRARGQGLASRMLQELLGRDICAGVRFLETTITSDNEASWALFRALAKHLDAELNDSVFFDRDRHFLGEHDSENLVRIGPFRNT